MENSDCGMKRSIVMFCFSYGSFRCWQKETFLCVSIHLQRLIWGFDEAKITTKERVLFVGEEKPKVMFGK